MFIQLNKRGLPRVIASFLLLNFGCDLFLPNIIAANGVGQVDTYGSPDGTSQMVDLATGNFSYDIPLANLDGYPLNLTYNAGARMEDEASWVGLGWSLSPGAVNRTMRGIPDEFNGEDKIQKTLNYKTLEVKSITPSYSLEYWGLEKGDWNIVGGAEVGITLRRSSYTGNSLGLSFSPTMGIKYEKEIEGDQGIGGDANFNLGYDFSIDSQNGYSRNFYKTFGLGIGASSGAVLGKVGFDYTHSKSYNTLTGNTLSSSEVSPSLTLGFMSDEGSLAFNTQGTMKTSDRVPSATFSFAPMINHPTETTLFGSKKKVGWLNNEGFFHSIALKINTSSNSVQDKEITESAYGYFYAQGKAGLAGVMDINREGEQVIDESNKSLPIAQHTYDLFNASASGLNLSFRGIRREVGTLSDNNASSINKGGDTGIELGILGNNFKFGVNPINTVAYSKSNKWEDHNELEDKLKFEGRDGYGDEPFYFKSGGDLSAIDETYYTSIGYDEPLRPQILKTHKKPTDMKTNDKLERSSNDPNPIVVPQNGISRAKRELRGNTISYLTAFDQENRGVEHHISVYGHNDFTFGSNGKYIPEYTLSPLTHAGNKGHHPSQIKVVGGNGWRYDYGVPVYNREKTDYTFSVNASDGDKESGFVKYNNNDITKFNNKNDEFFSQTTLKDYAETYLLTAAVSPDYSDIGQDGLSPDDLGNYAKFNYHRYDDAFQWRVPNTDYYETDEFKANYSEGFNSGAIEDDKGFVMFGKKELWYMHSIETKNYVAEFHLEDRKDGLGFLNKNGGVDADEKKQLLKKIRIFSLDEKMKSGVNAKPLKEIEFFYSYALCKGVPNFDPLASQSERGKLTLEKLVIKDNSSESGEYAPYVFKYGVDHVTSNPSLNQWSTIYNPDYDKESKDHWGVYKPQTDGTIEPYNGEYPFTEQNDLVNGYASSWNLNQILLPTGGRIEVDYESDEYGHVQDRKAMRYFNVVYLENNRGASSTSNELYTANRPNLRMYVDLGEDAIDGSVSQTDANIAFRSEFMARIDEHTAYKNIEYLLYKFFVKLNPGGVHEWVQGYAKLSDKGGVIKAVKALPNQGPPSAGSDYRYGVIELASMATLTKGTTTNIVENVHPVTYMANQIGLHGLSKELVPGNNSPVGFSNIFSSMGDLIKIDRKGADRFFRDKDVFKTVDLNKCYVRLYKPDYKKKGGGHRVKEIRVFDNWDDMTSNGGYQEQEAYYGTSYEYTTKELGREMSSGVASYEPLVGGDENPFKETNNELISGSPGLFGRTMIKFNESPHGASLIPNGKIVYSKITQKSIQKSNVDHHRTGKTVTSFYTAKDYPTKFSETELYNKSIQPNGVKNFVSYHSRYGLYRSQGFSIYLNNMHGKQKAVDLYAEGEIDAYYHSEHLYKKQTNNLFDNKVKTIGPDGVVEEKVLGIDIELVTDAREVKQETNAMSHNFNIDFKVLGIPIPVVTYFYFKDTDKKVSRSHSSTKVIQQYGLLEKTKESSEGKLSESEIVLRDEETGEALAVVSTNPKDDASKILSYSIPSRWYYEGMGHASKNIGVIVPRVLPDFSNDESLNQLGVIHSGVSDYFFPGDEVLVYTNQGIKSYWVINGGGSDFNGQKVLIDKNGDRLNMVDYTNYTEVKIIRSGRRNLLQDRIGGGVAKVQNNYEPTTGSTFSFPTSDVINISAQEYNENWQTHGKIYPSHIDYPNCLTTSNDDESCNVVPGTQINPYIKGVLGVWRPDKAYVYRNKRGYAASSNPPTSSIGTVNLEVDGMYDVLPSNQFWHFDASKLEKQANVSNWIQTGELSKVSSVGIPIETKDINNIYKSVQLGYANTAVKAKAVNAEAREIFFDGFEDKGYYSSIYPVVGDQYACTNEQPEYWSGSTNYSNLEAHSGKHALLLSNSASVSFSTVMLDEITPSNAAAVVPYVLTDDEIISGFAPRLESNTAQKYFASFWMKTDWDQFVDYNTSTLTIQTDCDLNTTLPTQLEYESPVIDGWKQIQLSFDIPPVSTQYNKLQLKLNNLYSGNLFIDDFRLLPYDAEMTSYVFDMEYHRISSSLDAQNFATFYQYDESGMLISIRKETEKGIQTISESRGSIYKRD